MCKSRWTLFIKTIIIQIFLWPQSPKFTKSVTLRCLIFYVNLFSCKQVLQSTNEITIVKYEYTILLIRYVLSQIIAILGLWDRHLTFGKRQQNSLFLKILSWLQTGKMEHFISVKAYEQRSTLSCSTPDLQDTDTGSSSADDIPRHLQGRLWSLQENAEIRHSPADNSKSPAQVRPSYRNLPEVM